MSNLFFFKNEKITLDKKFEKEQKKVVIKMKKIQESMIFFSKSFIRGINFFLLFFCIK
jgi:hypothetical protein